MKRIYWFLICCLPIAGFAQSIDLAPDPSVEPAGIITPELISKHLHILAADEMEGRETGTAGNTRAGDYIARQFADMGIPPVPALGGYFQNVSFSKIKIAEAQLKINGNAFAHLKDFIVPALTMPRDHVSWQGDELIFLGYGIDDAKYSDYHGRKVAGKAIVIFKGEPTKEDGTSWITNTGALSDWSKDLNLKLRAAASHGVAMVFVLEDRFRERVREERMYTLGGETVMGDVSLDHQDLAPHVLFSSSIASSLLGGKADKVVATRDKIRARGKPKAVRLKVNTALSATRTIDKTPGRNVLGFIEGTDPTLKDEIVVVSAHYDHLGTRGDEIFNGADDNGSGTSAVLAIANAYQRAKDTGIGPRRSVLCILMTGEEKGLLGSEYYAMYPVFPLENTVVDVNIDMIGRVDNQHEDPNYVYVIGADRLSSELHSINEDANQKYTRLELDYTYNAHDDPNRFYYRSDHYNFAKHGIPAIFYFSGVHDDYHRPTDTVDKILFDKAAKIAQLAFHTSWELANRDARIRIDRRS